MTFVDITFTINWIHVFLFFLVLTNGIWNTSVGSTGGVTFAALAATLSPAVAIPVQSVVEGISGAYRSWTLRGYVSRVFLALFMVGGVAGGAVGDAIVSGLNDLGQSNQVDSAFRLVVACLLLLATWVPIGRSFARLGGAPILVGAATTIMSLFVGGMGTLVATSVKSRGEGQKIVMATYSTAVIYQYGMRLLIFGLVGFSFAAHAGLILALTIASLIGTWLGGHILLRIDPKQAHSVFRVVVTLIAFSMIVRVIA